MLHCGPCDKLVEGSALSVPVEAHGRQEHGEVGLPALRGLQVSEELPRGHRGGHADLGKDEEGGGGEGVRV